MTRLQRTIIGPTLVVAVGLTLAACSASTTTTLTPTPTHPPVFNVPPGATTYIPVMHGRGSVNLPTFTPTTAFYNLIYSCSGPGKLMFVGSDGSTATQEVCPGGFVSDGQSEIQTGVPLSLKIEADPATTWEILVYGVNTSLEQP